MDKLIKLTNLDSDGEGAEYYIRLNDIIGITRGTYEWDRYILVKGVRGGLPVDEQSFQKARKLLEEQLEIN